MMQMLPLILAAAAGLGFGLYLFRRIVADRPLAAHSALARGPLLGSLVGRTAVTLVGFYLVMAGRWERLLAA